MSHRERAPTVSADTAVPDFSNNPAAHKAHNGASPPSSLCAAFESATSHAIEPFSPNPISSWPTVDAPSSWLRLPIISNSYNNIKSLAEGMAPESRTGGNVQAHVRVHFQFLNFSHPSDAQARTAQRVVRSHVTRQQHQREHAAAAARRVKKERQQCGHVMVAAGVDSTASNSLHTVTGSTSQWTPVRVTSVSRGERASSSSVQSFSAETSPVSPSHSSLLSERRVDITELYPKPWHSCIPRILDQYFSNMVVDIPELQSPDAHGLLRTQVVPFVMTDPAPLSAVMLIAASHHSNAHDAQYNGISLLHLRGIAISTVTAALEDPVRATSDQVIAAVATLASHEAIYGDRATFHAHMTGLLRMVSLRGGLPALGLDGVLERILLWVDANAACVTQSRDYFDPAAFPSRARHPRPDPRRFQGARSGRGRHVQPGRESLEQQRIPKLSRSVD